MPRRSTGYIEIPTRAGPLELTMSLETTTIFLEPMYGLPHSFQRTPSNRLKIDHNHPEVAKDLLSWGPWVLQVCLLGGGIRLGPSLTQRNYCADDRGDRI